ncbi:EAL domain-containing protein [Galenea microaerophila]
MFKSLKTPILLGFLIILTMLLSLSGHLLFSNFTKYESYQTAQKTYHLSNKIQKLITLLAQERGLHYIQSLNQSTKQTDAAHALSSFNKLLKSAETQTDRLLTQENLIHALETHYPNQKALISSLKQLDQLRKRKQSFKAYSALIAQLAAFNQQMLSQATLPLSNNALSLDLTTLNTLTNLKELFGQERGIVMQILLSKKLDTDHYFLFSGIVQRQKHYLKKLSDIYNDRQFLAADKESKERHEAKHIQQLLTHLNTDKYQKITALKLQIRDQFLLQQRLLDLLSVIGYGGFIHHYKNYILRHDSLDYHLAEKDLKRLKQILPKLAQLAYTSRQKQDLEIIQRIFSLYEEKLKSMDLYHDLAMNTDEIDDKVKIDTAASIEAIQDLKHFYTPIPPLEWWQLASQPIQEIALAEDKLLHCMQEEVEAEVEALKQVNILIFIGLLLITLILILLMQYIFSRIKQISLLSDELGKMSTSHYFHPINIDGKDEVASLAKSFNTLIRDRENYEQEIWTRSHLDPLTQLPNRGYLLEILNLLIKQHQRNQEQLALLFIDLDGFKNINDSKGHHVGDQLLQTISKRIQICIRSSDIASRLGGDEFVILIPQLKETEDTKKIAQKLIDAISKPVTIDEDLSINVSASIGIALYPKDANDGNTLLINADLAMYEAKSKGKNGYAYYHSDLSHTLAFKQTITESLSKIAKSGDPEQHGFYLTYQPIVDTQKNIQHFEALIRWNHPELGFLPPDRFIEIAELNQTIIPLGQWVIREAANQTMQWQKQFPHQEIHISINLSPVQAENGFASVLEVLDALQQKQFPVNTLHFEITEGLLMQNNQTILNGLQKIKDYGCNIYLDDFGTGYSSLSYLKRFPLDVLKIDRSFIMEILENKQDQELVKTILSIAHILHLKVVAEGVENEAQFEYLKAHGCEFIQGYWISKPLKGDEATEFLQKHLDK